MQWISSLFTVTVTAKLQAVLPLVIPSIVQVLPRSALAVEVGGDTANMTPPRSIGDLEPPPSLGVSISQKRQSQLCQ
jgi:hypothetical protein